MQNDIFISYTNDDIEVVTELVKFLESKDLTVAISTTDTEKLQKYINDCKIAVLVFSENYNNCAEVDNELELCSNAKKPILTYRISNTDFVGAKKFFLKNINFLDSLETPSQNFIGLYNAIEKLLAPDPNTIIKLLCDIDCNVFIDNRKISTIEANTIKQIEVTRSNHTLRVESTVYASVFDEQEIKITYDSEGSLFYISLLDKVHALPVKIELTQRKRYLVDATTNKRVLSLPYNDVHDFDSNGLARVSKNNKVGRINKLGQEVIKPKYKKVKEFSEGLAVFETFRLFQNYTLHNDSTKYGYINMAGKEVIPAQFSRAENFKNGYAKVGQGRMLFVINTYGETCADLTKELWNDEIFENENYMYTSNGKDVAILKYKGKEKSLVIPSEIDGCIVTSIGISSFTNCSNITNIELPNSITTIGAAAFSYCTSLISVKIPDTTTSIGLEAFSSCTSLLSIQFPKSLTSIGDYAFGNCTSLTSIALPTSLKKIGDVVFADCTSLTSVTIPDSVGLPADTFVGCENLPAKYLQRD